MLIFVSGWSRKRDKVGNKKNTGVNRILTIYCINFLYMQEL